MNFTPDAHALVVRKNETFLWTLIELASSNIFTIQMSKRKADQTVDGI